MPIQRLLVHELSQIISQAVAPAFLLGAPATFVSLLFGRLHRIADRSTTLALLLGCEPPISGPEGCKRRRQPFGQASRAIVVAHVIEFVGHGKVPLSFNGRAACRV
jgi:hypothetical protein